MREYKEVIRETKLKSLVKVICDICGKSSPDDDWSGGDRFLQNEVNVSFKWGNYYPDGGYGEETDFDICPECFKEKITPFLNSLGAKETFTQRDW